MSINLVTKSLSMPIKLKIQSNDIFDNEFLNDKDMALQPLDFLFELSDKLPQNNLTNNKKEKPKKKSLKESDLYDSNIIIIHTASEEEESGPTSFNQIEKEVEKIHKYIIKKKQMKKLQRHHSKSKKGHNLVV